MTRKSITPGPKYGLPNTLGFENHDVSLERAPAFSLGHLLPLQPSVKTPGPKYALGKITRHGPPHAIGTSLAAKDHTRRTQRGPGPTAYDIAPCLQITTHATPKYSMGTKLADRSTGRMPAPNAYAMASTIGQQLPNMACAPMFSILGRLDESSRKQGTPGPARYAPISMAVTKTQTPRPVILGRLDPNNRTAVPAPNKYAPGRGGSRFANAPMYSLAARIPDQADPFYTEADKVPDWYK